MGSSGFSLCLLACRMSGEMNTSLGNGFTNLILFLFFMQELGNEDFCCVVEGDDLLAKVDGPLPSKEDYERAGFTIKVERHLKLSDCSFCGLVFDENEMICIADPLKIIMKMGWSSHLWTQCSKRTRLRLLKSKALSCYHQYRGVPIVQAFSWNILRLLAGVRPLRDTKDWYNNQIALSISADIKRNVSGKGWRFADVVELHHLPPPLPIGQGTRELMASKFKFTIWEQQQLEQFFHSWEKLEPWQHFVIEDKFFSNTHADLINPVSLHDIWNMYVGENKQHIFNVPINVIYDLH